MGWRGASVTWAGPLDGRTAISSQRAVPVKWAGLKSSVTVNKPLVTSTSSTVFVSSAEPPVAAACSPNSNSKLPLAGPPAPVSRP